MSNFSLINNSSSSIAQSKLSSTSSQLNKTLQRLSSGLRITRSGDDAAGLAIANTFRSDVSVFRKAFVTQTMVFQHFKSLMAD